MSTPWWKAKEGGAHAPLTQLLKHFSENQSYRSAENLRYARLYGNVDLMQTASLAAARPNPLEISNRVTFNVIESAIDTAASKIAKNRPKPTFLTDGGNPALQKKAKKLTKFIAGTFYKCGVYATTPRCFTFAGVMGTGAYKVYSIGSEIFGELANTDELFVDDREAVYGKPQTLYQNKLISRSVLKELYPSPEHAFAIDALKPADSTFGMMANDGGEAMVIVTEAWRLPSKKGAKDGRHVICIEGADLLNEPWTRMRFPFAFFHWSQKLFGFFGRGMAEQLVGSQLEINKTLKNIQKAHHFHSRPIMMRERGSKVITSHLNNDFDNILDYTGTKPSLEVFQTVHPEIYQHLENEIRRAYEKVGLSQLSANAQKPAGLDSGKALREYNDIESERWIIAGQAWEAFHLDIAALMIDEGREIYKRDKNFSVKAKGKKFLETIKWSEVDLDDDQYIMQCFPTSSLSSTPSGKIQDVQELSQAGLIEPDMAPELLDFPDLEAYSSLKVAAKMLVRDIVERIIEEGEYTSPEPFMDLSYAVAYTQMAYNRAKLDNVEEEHLELLRRFIEQATQLAAPPEAPAPAPQPGAMPMDPLAVPEAPPVSDLLPQG